MKGGNILEAILILIYMAAGYWATGLVFFYNKVVIHKFGALFVFKVVIGLFLGFILIPIALILKLTGRR